MYGDRNVGLCVTEIGTGLTAHHFLVFGPINSENFVIQDKGKNKHLDLGPVKSMS